MFLWIGSAIGVFVGAGLLFNPQQVLKLNQYSSRWVGAGHFGQMLDRPRWTERYFYRHSRVVGAGLFVGALIVLYTFLFSYNPRTISAFVPRDYWWLSDALIGMILVGGILSAMVGIIVLAKPSLLRDIEKSANHWVSTERLLALFNNMHFSAEQSILRHPRLAGVSILLGSLYILVVLGYFLFRGAWK
ncbi:MAG: hypothetical protein NT159_17020 [Proteobacteria bacterium]|nr:hypothetical protein [Pseudomonadota bacterium]